MVKVFLNNAEGYLGGYVRAVLLTERDHKELSGA